MVSAVVPLGAAGLRASRWCAALHRVAGTAVGLGGHRRAVRARPRGAVLIGVIVLLQVLAELLVGRNYALALVAITPLALLMVHLVAPVPAGVLLLDRGRGDADRRGWSAWSSATLTRPATPVAAVPARRPERGRRLSTTKGAGPGARRPSRASLRVVRPGSGSEAEAQLAEDLVEQVGQLAEEAAEAAVEQAGHRAEQVAEQVAGAGRRRRCRARPGRGGP